MSNKQQTPIQRLIAKYQKELDEMIIVGEYGTGEYNKVQECLDQAESLLPYEREVIENFHVDTMKKGLKAENEIMWIDAYYPKIKQITQESFTQTFQTNE
jgi:hypothetical protein